MVVDADEYEEEEEKSTYLADGECDCADVVACGCIGEQTADALACGCGGVQMRW